MFGLFKKFKDGLKKTAENALGGWISLFGRKIDESDIDKIEETLYGADFGYDTTEEIVGAIRAEYKRNKELHGKRAAEIGAAVLEKILSGSEGALAQSQDDGKPSVICLVGVNGAGKTTTAAKLAYLLGKNGDGVVLGACDTFRAAANEQIREWARRLDVRLVESSRGADSAATAWDAWQSAKAKGAKWLVIDTAGRLHTSPELMRELAKVVNVTRKRASKMRAGAMDVYVVLVIDAATGQNGLTQASEFNDALGLDGIIMTKLDGTAKGGIALAISSQLGLPIYRIGVGEAIDDLQTFDALDFCRALVGEGM